MSEYLYDKTKILEQTNGGLEVIKRLYPNEKLFSGGSEKKPVHFRVGFMSEETPSFIIVPNTLGSACVVVKSFKDGDTYTCFSLVMEEKGLSFGAACKWIAENLNLTLGGYTAKHGDFEFKDATEDQEVGTTYIDYNENLTNADLAVLGPLVGKKEVEIFKLRSAKSVTKIKQYNNHPKHGNAKKQLVTVATEDYPVLVYDYGTWQKIYQPFGKYEKTDKTGKTTKVDVRFSYAGEKPTNFVFGLESLEDYYQEEWKFLHYDEEQNIYEKFKNVLIAGGDRDGLNASSLGYPVVWLNSETAKLDHDTYKRLLKIADNVCYCGDLDATGVKETIKLALQFIDVKVVWLPSWIRSKRGKDLTDFAKLVHKKENPDFVINQFKSLVYNALPARFWDEIRDAKGKLKKLEFNNEAISQFLVFNGFNRYEDENGKDDYEFIRIENGVVERVLPHHIVNFPLEWARRKNKPVALRNQIQRSPQISEKRFIGLPQFKPNFKNTGPDFQRMFFSNKVVTVGKNNITAVKYEHANINVWKDKIIDHDISIDAKKSFKITKEGDKWDIEILNENNSFLNYLINTSRLHWRVFGNKPYEDRINKVRGKEISPDEKEAQIAAILKERNAYRADNKFNLQEKGLSTSQLYEQKLCLINKLFAWGYLLHEEKLHHKGWAVYGMDNKVSDVGESNGGSGKSLFFDLAMEFLLKKTKTVNGRQKDLDKDKFIYDGVTKDTSYFLIDDISPYFPLDILYSPITTKFPVNPKGFTPYVLDFKDSPKIAITSNSGIYNAGESTMRRLLIVPFSDYYHAHGKDDLEAYSPNDDFGKNLITQFNKEETNDFINLALESIQFYLNTPGKVDAKSTNVDKRNALESMGNDFKDSLDAFLTEDKFNTEILKEDLMEAYNHGKTKKLKSSAFKKKLQSYCDFYGLALNPPYEVTLDQYGRIMKTENKQQNEYLYIKDFNLSTQVKDNRQAMKEDSDLPF